MTQRTVSGSGNRTVAVASLAVLATFLDTTALYVAFPDIVRTFADAGPTELSWVLNAYTITVAALLVPAGKIADRWGHKRTFLAGSALFSVASLLCALATNETMLIAFRVVQAVGAASLIPASFALVLRAVPPQRIPIAVAIWGATGALAGALGPTLGAALIELGGWRLVFLINLPVGIFTIVAGRRVLAESSDPSTPVPDLLGVLLISLGAASVSLGLVQSETWGWGDQRTVGAFLVGAGLLVIFVAHQRRSTAPALDLDLFAISNFTWANLAVLAFGIAFSAMFFGSILFLTEVWGWSILEAGFGVAPGPLLVAIAAPNMGRLATRVGQRPLIVVGGVLFAVGGLLRLLLLDGTADYVGDYLPSMLFSGLGVALCIPQLSSTVAQSLPPNRLGVGAGTHQAMRQFGGTFGVALTVAAIGRPASLDDALRSFDQVWWMLVAGGVATALLALPLVTRPATPAAGADPAGRAMATP